MSTTYPNYGQTCRFHLKTCLFLTFILLFEAKAATVWSEKYGKGFNVALFSDTQIFSSPPVPMMINLKGVSHIGLQPNYYTGKKTQGEYETDAVTGEFKGKAFGFNLGYAFKEKMALMIIGLKNSFDGDFTSSGTNSNDTFPMAFKGVTGDSTTLGLGMSYELFGRISMEKFFFSGNVFGGFFYKKATYEQSLVLTNSSGFVYADFDMKVSPTYKGIFLGEVAEMRFGEDEFWGGKLYLLEFLPFGVSEFCEPYEVTAVRKDVGPYSQDGTCFGKPQQIFLDIPLSITLGVTLEIGPYISANIIRPFFDFSFSDMKGVDTSIYSLTFNYNFGDAKKKKTQVKLDQIKKRDTELQKAAREMEYRRYLEDNNEDQDL